MPFKTTTAPLREHALVCSGHVYLHRCIVSPCISSVSLSLFRRFPLSSPSHCCSFSSSYGSASSVNVPLSVRTVLSSLMRVGDRFTCCNCWFASSCSVLIGCRGFSLVLFSLYLTCWDAHRIQSSHLLPSALGCPSPHNIEGYEACYILPRPALSIGLCEETRATSLAAG